MSGTDPRPIGETYAERGRAIEGEIAALEARSGRMSGFRALSFVVALATLGYAAFRHAPPAVLVVGALAAAAFVALVVGHAIVHARIDALRDRLALVRRGEARLAGDASGNPTGERFLPEAHPYAGDLDLFGHASLFQLVCTAETALGEATLASWLLAGASTASVTARQEAVRELATHDRLREDLAFEGRAARGSGEGAAKLLAWLEPKEGAASPLSPRFRGLALAARALPLLTIALFVAGELAGARLGPWRHAWLATALLQLVLRTALRPAVDPIVVEATSRETPLARHRRMLELVESASFTAPLLRAEAAKVGGAEGAPPASVAMRRLERIVGFAELRHQSIVHFVAEAVLGWDVHAAVALERWRAAHGARARSWLDALGAVEALASIATFAREHPSFTFPAVGEGPARFEAKALAHPLLREGVRVANDVALVAPGEALLVTGSNMSGKSTLLRAMGTAQVLALAGAPVCAASLRTTTLAVYTSMRIRDSLEAGVSHFYAELERLKGVVDAVDRGEPVMFLLDEILHGTNSRERQIGAKAVVRHLVDRGAIGAVTSHDLGLAALEGETAGRVVNVHFEEHVEAEAMTFDYTLRPGPVTTANALRLMKRVGLPVEADG